MIELCILAAGLGAAPQYRSTEVVDAFSVRREPSHWTAHVDPSLRSGAGPATYSFGEADKVPDVVVQHDFTLRSAALTAGHVLVGHGHSLDSETGEQQLVIAALEPNGDVRWSHRWDAPLSSHGPGARIEAFPRVLAFALEEEEGRIVLVVEDEFRRGDERGPNDGPTRTRRRAFALSDGHEVDIAPDHVVEDVNVVAPRAPALVDIVPIDPIEVPCRSVGALDGFDSEVDRPYEATAWAPLAGGDRSVLRSTTDASDERVIRLETISADGSIRSSVRVDVPADEIDYLWLSAWTHSPPVGWCSFPASGGALRIRPEDGKIVPHVTWEGLDIWGRMLGLAPLGRTLGLDLWGRTLGHEDWGDTLGIASDGAVAFLTREGRILTRDANGRAGPTFSIPEHIEWFGGVLGLGGDRWVVVDEVGEIVLLERGAAEAERWRPPGLTEDAWLSTVDGFGGHAAQSPPFGDEFLLEAHPRGNSSTILHIGTRPPGTDGEPFTLLGSWSLRFESGSPARSLVNGLALDPEGRVWTFDGGQFVRVDEEGMLGERFGETYSEAVLHQRMRIGIGADSVCVLDQTTGVVHRWDEQGEQRGRSKPLWRGADSDWYFYRARLRVDARGAVHALGDDEVVTWTAEGELGPTLSTPYATGFALDEGDVWTWGFVGGVTRISKGAEDFVIDRDLDDRWIRSVLDVCAGPGGTLYVLHGVASTAVGGGPWTDEPKQLTRFRVEGTRAIPEQSAVLPADARNVHVTDDWVIVKSESGVLLRRHDGEAWSMFSPGDWRRTVTGVSADGRTLIGVHPYLGAVSRWMLPVRSPVK